MARGFSIREYAAERRSVDVAKSWPFGGEVKEEEMRALLPPMTWRSQRWWCEELEIARSREEEQNGRTVEIRRGSEGAAKVCPVCERFSAATANALSAHIDGCLAEARPGPSKRKSKKARSLKKKKRSIVEIFAAAPLIGDGSDGRDGVRKSKKAKKKKKKLNKKSKDIIDHINLPPVVDFSWTQKIQFRNRKFSKEITVPAGIKKKKKSPLKRFPIKGKVKMLRSSKLTDKLQPRQTAVFPVRSILKKQTRLTSMDKDKGIAVGGLQRDDVSQIHYARLTGKHVKFSDKDDILDHNKKWFSSHIDLPQLQSFCKAFSDVLEAASVMDRPAKSDMHLPASNLSRTENVGDATTVEISDHGRGVQAVHEKEQTSDNQSHLTLLHDNSSKKSCSDVEETPDESMDLNLAQHNFNKFLCCKTGSSSTPNDPSHTNVLEIPNPVDDDSFSSDVVNDAEGKIQGAHVADQSHRNFGAMPTPCSSEMCSLTNISSSTSSQTSASSISISQNVNESCPHPAVSINQNVYSCSSQFPQSPSFYPQDRISGMYSSADQNNRVAHNTSNFSEMKIIRSRYTNEEFMGLPLNSQGELIQLHPNGSNGFSQLLKKQNTSSVGGFTLSSFAEPTRTIGHLNMSNLPVIAEPPKENLQWFPEQYYSSASASNSWPCFTEFHDGKRTEMQQHYLVRHADQRESGRNITGVSLHGCREYNQAPCILGREKIQANCNQKTDLPTMRLMGKTVTVGRNNDRFQGFDDGKVWTDKEIIREQRTPVRMSGHFRNHQFQQEVVIHPVPGTSKATPVQAQVSSVSPNSFQIARMDPRVVHTFMDGQAHLMSRSDHSLMSRSQGGKFDHFENPFPMQAKSSRTTESSTSGDESGQFSYKIPFMRPGGQSFHQHMMFNPTGYSSASGSPYTMVYQDHGKYVQSPSAPRSSAPNMPQWLLNAKQHKNSPSSSYKPYSDPGISDHSCTLSATDLMPVHSPYPASMISFPAQSSSASHANMQSISNTPIVYPSFVPSFAVIGTSSAVNANSVKKSKKSVTMKSNYPCSVGTDNQVKTKKRPSSEADVLMRPTKMPKSDLHIDSITRGLRRVELLNGNTENSAGKRECHVYRNKSVNCDYPEEDVNRVRLQTSPSINSTKVEKLGRQGPIKLTAGAKHIFKPGQSSDRDSSKLTHSTIPFSVAANSGEIPLFLKKPAKIYRL
ncbi:hypothetical protein QJS10_CPB20g01742 [Acorus calamus]|uniref:UBZ4-type domain-containing protein n=1 Tax=Acorus calamus TaxID=4465 RepID=A0AAV9CC62_ACOCL|nr:hypothetical protein QJS10_CPB20g01742 [Acorus calamus]